MAQRIVIPGAEELDATQAAEGFEAYGGPTPPAGVYRVVVGQWKYNEANRNGDPYYTVRLRLAHAEGEPKSRFNGYSRTTNLTLTDQQRPYNKQFIEAVGLSAKAFHSPVVEDDGSVSKLGNTDPTSLRLRVSFTNGTPYQGRRSLEARSFFVDKDDATDVVDVIDADTPVSYDDGDAPGPDGYSDYEPVADAVDPSADAVDPWGPSDDVDSGPAVLGDDWSDDAPAEPAPAKAAPAKAVKAAPAKAAPRKSAAF